MEEVFHAAFSPANFVPTILLIIVVLYWLMVILGALDLGFLDFDLEADYESDFEIEVDINTDTDINADGSGASWLMELLSWFNLGKVPFMVFVTCVSIPTWLISVNLNHYLFIENWLISLGLLIPTLLFSMFLSKFITIPLVTLFDKLDADGQESINPIGKKCTITLKTTDKTLGQAMIKIDGTTNLINVKTRAEISLNKGETALVIEEVKGANYFVVAPYTEI